MKTIFKVLSLFVLLLGLAGLSFGQAVLQQTTLTTAVNGTPYYTNTPQTTITVASVTGMVAEFNGSFTSVIVVDQEAMGVISFNASTLIVNVQRGYAGTKTRSHVNGATVYVGPPSSPNPNWFKVYDPNGACTAALEPVLPTVSLASGDVFNCDATTGNWIKSGTAAPFMFADGSFYIGEATCTGSTTGTAGSGNATDILTGSGGARVYRVSATNASSSANTFVCNFNVPARLTANKGCLLTDVTFLVSPQTTIPTSITLPTLKTFTVPAAAATETANSATFVTSGGTLAILPTSANFATFAAVSAGQFYSIKTTLGTPVFVNTDLQQFQYTIVFNQSASAASLQETPGLVAHCTNYPL